MRAPPWRRLWSRPYVADAMAAYRPRVMYALALLGIAGILPFAINNFLQGRVLLGFVTVLVLATLAVDAAAIARDRPPPIAFELLLIPMALGMGLSLRSQGVIGALWCYPIVLFLFFVVSRRIANAFGAALVVVGTLMVERYVGRDVALRFGVTLTLTIIAFNIILNILGELQFRLVEQANTDPLTGVPNRRSMVDALEAVVAGQAPASLLLVDVDRFKAINDRFGHEAGDAVLTGLVTLVRRHGRANDVLFRMGGDEFLLCLPVPIDAALARAEHLRAEVQRSPLLARDAVTVSIGVAERRAGDTLDGWIRRADEALYAAKRAGRNRVGQPP